MARALRVEFEGALYHLCARGNRRGRIFGVEKDWLDFIELLGRSLERYQVELHAYVLLPNHFHLVALTRKANLSRWMHWLLVSYSVLFNRRHRSSGHLFQGRYKSFLVEGERGDYLLNLSRYLHLNPVRGRILGAGTAQERRDRLRGYRWSSYRGYAGLGAVEDFICQELILGELGRGGRRKLQYRRFVEEGLLRDIKNPFELVRWQSALGSESFLQKIRDKLNEKEGREITGVRKAALGRDGRALLARVAAGYKLPVNDLVKKRIYGSEAHNVGMWLLWERAGLSLREIGFLFGGLDYAAVSQRIQRMHKRLQQDSRLRNRCNKFSKS